MLWPDSDREQALANLRTTLSELRSALGVEGKRLESPSRHLLQVDLVGADVDIIEFDRCIATGRRSDLERAVALYQGPLLEGSSEEWVGQEQGTREQDCLRALQTLGEACCNAGDYRAAVAWFRRATTLDPWWDAAQRGLMEALAGEGDVNEALLVYRQFEERLRAESATHPDEATTELYTRLRGRARAKREPVAVVRDRTAGHLPAPITNLIGREDERTDVAILLRRSRLVTLTGVGGIGKTRLAIALANTVAAEFVDGCWFVPLDAIADGEGIPRQIGAIFGLAERSGQTWQQIVIEHLRAKHVLLVLDNCEHVIDPCARTCANLLHECPGLRIVATSREAMAIIGESVWSVPSLPVPDPDHLPEGLASRQRVIAGYEGVQLFLERARSASNAFELNASNVEAITAICHGLEGVPLAIELAAAHVRSLSPHQISARLGDHLELLSGTRSFGPRQQTLRSTLDWSYKLLSEEEQALLRRLSVFVGGWTLSAAQQVCCGDGIDTERVAVLMKSLIEKSLVAFLDNATVGERYRLLESVRQYAFEKLCEMGRETVLRSRLQDWIVEFAEEAEPNFKGTDPRDWSQKTAREIDNIRSVLRRCIGDGDPVQAGMRIAGALSQFWFVRGEYREGREFLEATLELDVAELPTVSRAKVLHGLAVLVNQQGDHSRAKEIHTKSLEIRTTLGEKKGVAESLVSLASIAYVQSDYSEALSACEKALPIIVELGDRSKQGRILAHIGTILLSRGEFSAARSRFEESLVVSKEVNDIFQISWTRFMLGSLASARRDIPLARDHFGECRSRFAELGDKRGLAWTILELGLLELSECHFPSARDLITESQNIFDELGDQNGIFLCRAEFGILLLEEGDYRRARTEFLDCLSHFEAAGEGTGIASANWLLSVLSRREGDLDAALSAANKSMALSVGRNHSKGIVDCLEERALIAIGRGQTELGIQLWGTASHMREQLDYFIAKRQLADFDPKIDEAKAALGEEAFSSALAVGQRRTWQDAVATLDLPLNAEAALAHSN